jgi:hypothetical protein
MIALPAASVEMADGKALGEVAGGWFAHAERVTAATSAKTRTTPNTASS